MWRYGGGWAFILGGGGGELFRLGVIGHSFCMPNGPSDAIGRLAHVETPVPRNGFAQSHNNSL